MTFNFHRSMDDFQDDKQSRSEALRQGKLKVLVKELHAACPHNDIAAIHNAISLISVNDFSIAEKVEVEPTFQLS